MLVLTQGDPDGIGPELVLRAVQHGALADCDRVVANPPTLVRAAKSLGGWAQQALRVLTPLLEDPGSARQTDSLRLATDLVLEAPGERALVTAPIDKSIARAEGLAYLGHTEYLAARAGTKRFGMLMSGPRLRIALATIHVPLARVPGLLKTENIIELGRLLEQTLRDDLGLETPRIGILGLNPHAGEGGLLGDEEQRIIAPAVRGLVEMGVDARGPMPADTAMHVAASGQLDALLAMYHDQGLGPFKLLHFHDGVNVTMGLPFVRTSPDHGTAKDIAGKGVASPASFLAAIESARSMLARRSARAHDSR